MSDMSRHELDACQAAEWLTERAGRLQTHIGQAFRWIDGTKIGECRHHENEAREKIDEIRQLCAILEDHLSATAKEETA